MLFSHDVAEIAGITSYSFGDEGINKHIILFKKVVICCIIIRSGQCILKIT